MVKKRILTLFLAATLLMMVALPLTVSAADPGIEVTVGSLSAKQGDEIVVPVTIDKNSGIWGFNWKLYYDSQVLRFDSVEFSTEGDFSKIDFLPIPKEEAKYPLVIQGTGNSVTENVTVTGVAAKVHFKVYVGVPLGETEVELKLDDPGNNIDVDFKEVALTSHKGVIKISEGLVSSDNKDDYPPEKPLEEVKNNPGYVGDNHNKNAADGGEGGIKWLLIIIGVVVLIGVVVVIWLFSGSDEDDDDDDDDDGSTPSKRREHTVKEPKEDTPTIPLDEEVPTIDDVLEKTEE